ncbi:MAG: hypothetical protein WCT07_00250 [Candidatus Paceibacterota bacterium]|jgi:hypothetical protein
MRTCLHEVGANLAVSFDGNSIIVSRYVRPLPFPGFDGEWQDVVTFTNEQDWYASKYQKQIVGDDNVAMIVYHWLDIAESNQPA